MISRERLGVALWPPNWDERVRARIAVCCRFAVGMAMGGALGFALFLSPLLLTPADCLLPNVRIEGHAVGGCRIDAIRSFLHTSLTPAKLWVATPERTWTVPVAEAGGVVLIDEAVDQAAGIKSSGPLLNRAWQSWDTILHGRELPVNSAWNVQELRGFLRKIAWVTSKPPVNAGLKRDGGAFLIAPSSPGRRMDLDATVSLIVNGYGVDHRRFEVVCASIPPRIHESVLRCNYELLSSFTTRFPRHKRNRTMNLTLATARLRGAIVLPGETFSFNRQVGERTPWTGYLVADIFVDHEVVPGIGGGVCQVSTTLYNAARRGRFKIVERHKHSLPVTYVAVGQDATVSYGGRDLKFVNNTPNPIYVDGWVEGSALTVQIWGSRETKGKVASRHLARDAEHASGRNVSAAIPAVPRTLAN